MWIKSTHVIVCSEVKVFQRVRQHTQTPTWIKHLTVLLWSKVTDCLFLPIKRFKDHFCLRFTKITKVSFISKCQN